MAVLFVVLYVTVAGIVTLLRVRNVTVDEVTVAAFNASLKATVTAELVATFVAPLARIEGRDSRGRGVGAAGRC